MFWSVIIAAAIISGLIYLMSSPQAARRLARSKDDDSDDEEVPNLEDEQAQHDAECQGAWKARMKVCDRISDARERLCESRKKISKAQKQIHNLKVAARQIHMETITVASNLTKELLDHHSSGAFNQAAETQNLRAIQGPHQGSQGSIKANKEDQESCCKK